jgi:hypothetical protein
LDAVLCGVARRRGSAAAGPARYDTLQRTQQAARLVAGTATEADDYLRQLGPGDAALPTVEGVVGALQKFLETRVAWWGGDG